MIMAMHEVELSRLLQECEADTLRVLNGCAQVQKVNRRDSLHLGWVPYKFSTKKTRVVPLYEALGGERVRNEDWGSVI